MTWFVIVGLDPGMIQSVIVGLDPGMTWFVIVGLDPTIYYLKNIIKSCETITTATSAIG